MARQRYHVDWSGDVPRIYQASPNDPDAVTLGEAKQMVIDHLDKARRLAQELIKRTRSLTADKVGPFKP